jgi:hypothetical protein
MNKIHKEGPVATEKAPQPAPRPPRYIKDGVDVYMHVDDLCRELDSVPLVSPAQVAAGFRTWKAGLFSPVLTEPVKVQRITKKKGRK